MGMVDDYRRKLERGTRLNYFKLEISLQEYNASTILPDTATAEGLDTIEILAHEVNVPKPRVINPITIDKHGEKFNIPGDKAEYEDITVNWRNEENFKSYEFILNWLNAIQKENFNKGAVSNSNTRLIENPEKLKANGVITMYDGDPNGAGSPTLKCFIQGMFPVDLTGYPMSFDSKEELALNTVIFKPDSYYFKNIEGNIIEGEF